MNKVSVERKYDEAVKYMADGYGYPKETVVDCYCLYLKMMLTQKGGTIEKDFIIEKFLRYINLNFEEKGLAIVWDYFFQKLSYEKIAKKYNFSSADEARRSVTLGVSTLRKAYLDNENWFIISQRTKYINSLQREVENEKTRAKNIKPANEWVNIEDMGLSQRPLDQLKKRGINTVAELLELSEEQLQLMVDSKSINDVQLRIGMYST